MPAEWLAEAVLEVVDRFGAAGYETQRVEGHWRHGGVVYRDNLVRIVVDVPERGENRAWLREFKDRWKAKLEQLDLWMVSYPIEIEQPALKTSWGREQSSLLFVGAAATTPAGWGLGISVLFCT